MLRLRCSERAQNSLSCAAHLPGLKAVGLSNVELKAIYSRSEKSAAGLAQDAAAILGDASVKPDVYFDDSAESNLDALLARADIDAVLVVLPITTQPGVILKSLAAGKHVLSEKPIAKDVETGLELIKEYETTYKPKGLVWRVAENFEADSAYQAASKAIREGKIGKVHNYGAVDVVYVTKESKYVKTTWRTNPDVSVTVIVCRSDSGFTFGVFVE